MCAIKKNVSNGQSMLHIKFGQSFEIFLTASYLGFFFTKDISFFLSFFIVFIEKKVLYRIPPQPNPCKFHIYLPYI